LRTIPPPPTYAETLPGPTSNIPPNVRQPQLTLHWDAFEQEVLDFIHDKIIPITERVLPPVFELLNVQIRDEVPMLQAFCSQNLFQVVAIHRDCTLITSEHGNTVGYTDSHIERNGRVIIVNEYKGKWSLDPDWFQNGRIDGPDINHYIRASVVQIYTYMILNHLQYGILTSFHYTFFLKRVKVEDASDGLEQLFISTGIAHDNAKPTILQCIAYFLSLADGASFTTPPPSPPRVSPRSSRASSARNSPLPSRKAADSSNANQNEEDADQHEEESDSTHGYDFALDDFNIKSVIGHGRTKVYYEASIKRDRPIQTIKYAC
jgi:hypothetical protein